MKGQIEVVLDERDDEATLELLRDRVKRGHQVMVLMANRKWDGGARDGWEARVGQLRACQCVVHLWEMDDELAETLWKTLHGEGGGGLLRRKLQNLVVVRLLERASESVEGYWEMVRIYHNSRLVTVIGFDEWKAREEEETFADWWVKQPFEEEGAAEVPKIEMKAEKTAAEEVKAEKTAEAKKEKKAEEEEIKVVTRKKRVPKWKRLAGVA